MRMNAEHHRWFEGGLGAHAQTKGNVEYASGTYTSMWSFHFLLDYLWMLSIVQRDAFDIRHENAGECEYLTSRRDVLLQKKNRILFHPYIGLHAHLVNEGTTAFYSCKMREHWYTEKFLNLTCKNERFLHVSNYCAKLF